MLNMLKKKWMAFKNLFDDDNNINEKSFIGFLAFLMPQIPAALYIPVGLYAFALGTMLYAAYLRKMDSQIYK